MTTKKQADKALWLGYAAVTMAVTMVTMVGVCSGNHSGNGGPCNLSESISGSLFVCLLVIIIMTQLLLTMQLMTVI